MTVKGKNRRSKGKAAAFKVVNANAAGIDVGSEFHYVSCPPGDDGEPKVRGFPTHTSGLEAIVEWLLDEGVDRVAMESTGVYWIPLYELLEHCGFDVWLVNSRHVQNIPGRPKSDVADCQWLRQLHVFGLLHASFRPDESICAVRALQRRVGKLVEARTKAVQWMQHSLDQMNVQVHRAVTDLTGKTGMAIVRAIVSGERSPQALAALRDKRCAKSESQFAEYLRGTWRKEHLFNLKEALAHYDHLEATIVRYEKHILEELTALIPEERRDAVPPKLKASKMKGMKSKGELELRRVLYRVAGVDMTCLDGIGVDVVQTVLTEVGPDLSRFSRESKWVNWLRLAPYCATSGGKRLNKRRRKGTGSSRINLKLRMAAMSLRQSRSALGAEYRRLARRKEASIAIFAIARKLAKLIYRMLRYGTEYVDIGEQAYNKRFEERRLAGLKRSAKELGFDLVPTTPLPAELPT